MGVVVGGGVGFVGADGSPDPVGVGVGVWVAGGVVGVPASPSVRERVGDVNVVPTYGCEYASSNAASDVVERAETFSGMLTVAPFRA